MPTPATPASFADRCGGRSTHLTPGLRQQVIYNTPGNASRRSVNNKPPEKEPPTDPGANLNSNRLSGSQGVTRSIKVTEAEDSVSAIDR
jgi:hypothetical protein